MDDRDVLRDTRRFAVEGDPFNSFGIVTSEFIGGDINIKIGVIHRFVEKKHFHNILVLYLYKLGLYYHILRKA
jgi:hypothetical protein